MKINRKRITTFEEAERYINDVPRFTAKNTLEDTRAFLHRLGDPDGKKRIIHVAGTNGKGSVCAYLRSILEAAGYEIAVFTSPHLVDIRERFVMKGKMISREEFLQAFLYIYHRLDWDALEEGKCGAYHPTYFEYLFLIAMVLFSECEPDFCILETGLGGRLDATNAVSHKELSVITHIGLDHVEYLGDTVEKIAAEKAGIMKPDCPTVFWDTCPGTTDVFLARARQLGGSCLSVSQKDYTFSNFNGKTIDFCLCTGYYRDVHFTLHTIAAYQMENCALAVRAVEVLDGGKTITAKQVQRGVSSCFWPGRMEEILPEVYVDGAHNEDGIRAFLETVAADGHVGGRSLLFGVVQDKDYEHMIHALAKSCLFDRFAAAPMQTGRTITAERLEGLFGQYPDCMFHVYNDVASALGSLLKSRGEKERIYAAGSLYLVGEIKELFEYDKF